VIIRIDAFILKSIDQGLLIQMTNFKFQINFLHFICLLIFYINFCPKSRLWFSIVIDCYIDKVLSKNNIHYIYIDVIARLHLNVTSGLAIYECILLIPID